MLNVLKAALLAAILSGLLVAGFTFFATEPVIEQAIALEESASAGHDEAQPVVSRDVQRGVGLVLGFELYGLTWGLLVGLAFAAGERWIPAVTRPRRVLVAAGLSFWAVAALPFVKYPADPPGAGDPETIAYRQTLYLAMLGLGCAGAIMAVALVRRLKSRTGSASWAWLAALLFLAAYTGLVALVMPSTPDEVGPPADLVERFRIMSFLGLTVFWAGFSLSFAGLTRVFEPRAL